MNPMTRTTSKRKRNQPPSTKVTRPAKTKIGAARREPLTVSGQELRQLLAPILPETFMTEYWGQKPLFIKGAISKLQKLIPGSFAPPDFYRAVHEGAANKIREDWLFAGSKDASAQFPTISPDQVETIAVGENVMAYDLGDQRVATFAAALKTQLHHLGEVTVTSTLSPAGNGLPPHVDRSSIFFLMCQGRKKFRISPEPALEWPRGTFYLQPDGAIEAVAYGNEAWEQSPPYDMSRLIEVALEPGDVLYIPAGIVHATEATSDSLNINILLRHAGFFDLINPVLNDLLFGQPDWRHLPSINPTTAEPGELPTEAKRFFAARLAELRAALDLITPESFELNRQWQKFIADPGVGTLTRMSLPETGSSDRPVQRKEILRISKRAPITYALGTDGDGDPCLHLYFATREMSVAGEWVPFLQTMVAQQRFTAESAMTWAENGQYPWKTVREYLETLLDQGLLEREED